MYKSCISELKKKTKLTYLAIFAAVINMENIGKTVVIIGIVIAAIGLTLWLFGNKLSWFGELPGDIRVEKENSKLYAPLISMLLISVLLTLGLWLLRKFFNT